MGCEFKSRSSFLFQQVYAINFHLLLDTVSGLSQFNNPQHSLSPLLFWGSGKL